MCITVAPSYLICEIKDPLNIQLTAANKESDVVEFEQEAQLSLTNCLMLVVVRIMCCPLVTTTS